MFLMAGIQLFGTKLSGFRNLSAAFWSIFQMAMLGENFIEDMLNADRNLITGLYIVMFYVINTTINPSPISLMDFVIPLLEFHRCRMRHLRVKHLTCVKSSKDFISNQNSFNQSKERDL